MYNAPDKAQDHASDKNRDVPFVFVPYSEALHQHMTPALDRLVPFKLEYRCVRLLDGTYDFSTVHAQ